jgi:nondiscriminating glutamyl-tRNA synthetase
MPRDSQDVMAASSAPDASGESPTNARRFSGAEVLAVLRERGWLVGEASTGQTAWCERAAALLSPHAESRRALTELLKLVFHYDAQELLTKVENHVVLSRYAARDVVRQLALLLLEPEPLSVERFKQIITALKEGLELRGRELFHPIRLALAGRAGEGELDRVILLLDEAAALNFAAPVKSARQRILEFCASLD